MTSSGVKNGAGLTLSWDDCGRDEWGGLLAGCGQSSLEQSWAYGDAVAAVGRRQVRRGVVRRAGAPLAIVQAFTRRPGLPFSLVQILRGPLWLTECDTEQRQVVYRSIRDCYRLRRRELLFWTPELPDTPESERLMRVCRCRRMVTGYSSVWLDLRPDCSALRAALHGKWRNALRRGECGGLTLRSGPGDGRLDWLLERHTAFRRSAGFVGPPGALVQAIASEVRPADLHVFCAYGERASAEAEPLAGILLLGHGLSATYYVAWTSPEGRRAQAHNVLLWRAIEALKAGGTQWLDLGGVDGRRAPGVARFKLGLGGRLFTLAGTYL